MCIKMATQGMITGVSAIYKRLLNHRPVIQNEVQFFVKEFEGTRGGSDHQLLKTSVDMTNEVESLMEEIARLSPLLKQITSQVQESNSLCDTIFAATERQLSLPAEVQQALDADVAEHHARLQAERSTIDVQAQEKLKQLKSDITRVREARIKLQAKSSTTVTPIGASVGSGNATTENSTTTTVLTATSTTVPSDVGPSTQLDSTTATVTSVTPTPGVGIDGTPTPGGGIDGTPTPGSGVVDGTSTPTPGSGVVDGTSTPTPGSGVVDGTPSESVHAPSASSEVVAGGDVPTPSHPGV